MAEIQIVYEGALRCTSTHQPSGAQIITDAPKDNHGKGEAFSPTDLVATALGTCMLTVMGIAAQTLQIDLRGSTVTVRKEMVSQPLRRIASLTVIIKVTAKLNAQQQKKLADIAMTCPVHQSLHPEVQMPIEFLWA